MASSTDLGFATCYDDCGDPIIQPLGSYEALLEWVSGQDEGCVCRFPLQTVPSRPSPFKTLVCHDMAGGYLEDRFPQGVNNSESISYQFTHWHMVDTFVYFSHRFITIPPPSWVAAAHKHGVKILGTFITEWDDGYEITKALLQSESSVRSVVDQMAAIAKYYNFDGWLINIENQVEPSSVDMLVKFVKLLTERCHRDIPSSEVIWYDSVTHTGELLWQNALNTLNSRYFDVCDGIFLNYTWTDENLKESREYALNRHRPYDVYVGVDVFGRGCRGGGGFNTVEAVGAARANDLSIALFAQGWTYERLPKEDFVANENKFWSLLSEFIPTRKLGLFPLCTDFSQGFGQGSFLFGKKKSSIPWYNMACQSLQPNGLNNFKGNDSGSNNNRVISPYTEDALSGNCCLKLEGRADGPEDKVTFNLFQVDAKLPEEFIVAVWWKAINEQTEMFVDLKLQCGNFFRDYRLFTVPKGPIVERSQTKTIGPKEDQITIEYYHVKFGSFQEKNKTMKPKPKKEKQDVENIHESRETEGLKEKDDGGDSEPKVYNVENPSGPGAESKDQGASSRSVEGNKKRENDSLSKPKTEIDYLLLGKNCFNGWNGCEFKFRKSEKAVLSDISVGLLRSTPGPVSVLLGALQVSSGVSVSPQIHVTFHKFSQSEREKHKGKLNAKSGWVSFAYDKQDMQEEESVEYYSIWGSRSDLMEDEQFLGSTSAVCFCLPLYLPSSGTEAQAQLIQSVMIKAFTSFGRFSHKHVQIPDDSYESRT